MLALAGRYYPAREDTAPESTMTLAETFDQLNWEAIESYVRLGQEENLHLDFKTVKNADMTATDDKRNLARGISGFANSNGGIIVWGVDARKNSDGVDCANKIAEISKPALMVSRLNALTGDATSPIVDGIRHRVITNPETNAGVVVTLVPETDSGPYMAKLGEQRYFKRSGDSFYQMEHFDLEDMFGRRQKPKLEITIEEGKKEGGTEELIVLLINQGRAVARHTGFLMSFQNAEIVGVDGQMQNITHINAGRPVVSLDDHTGVVHPNGIRINQGAIRVRRKDPTQPIDGEVRLYCEGARNVVRAFTFAPPPMTTNEEGTVPD
jgi:hypothetical protein